MQQGLLAWGQPDLQHDFTPLKPEGDIPARFLESFEDRYARLMAADSAGIDPDFWAESSYQLRQLLLSGKVLFGDPISQHLQALTDTILLAAGQPVGSVKAYAVKAASVNAFATSDRIILINVGLLASLHNEAELALVMSHELAHVLEGHPRYLYRKTRELARDKRSRWRRPDPAALLAGSNFYSRGIEQAADSLGLGYYLRAGYPAAAVPGAFAVLERAPHPFGNLPFQPDWLAEPDLRFPDSLLVSPPFLAMQADSSSGYPGEQTHPNTQSRLARLLAHIGQDSLAPPTAIAASRRFQELQSLARFETCYQYLLSQEYQAAFYSGFVLLQEYPHNRFLQRVMTQTLYTLSKYSNAGRRWELLTDFLDMEGPARNAYHFLEQLDAVSLNLLALAYAWEAHIRFPAEKNLGAIALDLMQDLGRFHGDQWPAGEEAHFSQDTPAISYIQPVLFSLLEKPAFAQAFSDQLQRVRRTQQRELKLEDLRESRQGRTGHELELKGFGLGLEKVVFVDPFYQRSEERPDRQGIRYAASAAGEAAYIEMLETYAREIGLEYDLISTHRMAQEDLTAFQEMMLLRDWIGEETRHQQLNLVNFHQSAVDALREQYGTEYFVWTGGLGITRPRTGKGLVLTGGLIFWPVLPYSIYYSLTPRHDTLLYSMIYNLETAEFVILYPKLLRMRDKPDVLRAATYDWLYQLHHRR